MKTYQLVTFCLLTSPALAQPAQLIWEGMPLSVTLPIGIEKRLDFPEPIRLDATMSRLYANQITLLNNQGKLYLKAKKSFKSKRLLIHLKRSSAVILLDINANAQGTARTVKIRLSDHTNTTQPSPLALMRYGVQSLYGKRAIESHPAIVTSTPSHNRWSQPGIQSKPLMQWHMDNYQLQAIELTNTSKTSIKIKLPQQARLVSFYPTQTLAPVHQCPDKTTIFILSNTP
jgi:hypothetical protein